MVINLSKGAQCGISNQRMLISSSHGDLREEDTVHQLAEDVEMGQQGSVPSNVGLDEVVG
jgi:hypothetical protein